MLVGERNPLTLFRKSQNLEDVFADVEYMQELPGRQGGLSVSSRFSDVGRQSDLRDGS